MGDVSGRGHGRERKCFTAVKGLRGEMSPWHVIYEYDMFALRKRNMLRGAHITDRYHFNPLNGLNTSKA